MTCTCGHLNSEHNYGVHEYPGNRWECDECDCDRFTDAATPPMFGDDDE